jgi:hypothetical protein
MLQLRFDREAFEVLRKQYGTRDVHPTGRLDKGLHLAAAEYREEGRTWKVGGGSKVTGDVSIRLPLAFVGPPNVVANIHGEKGLTEAAPVSFSVGLDGGIHIAPFSATEQPKRRRKLKGKRIEAAKERAKLLAEIEAEDRKQRSLFDKPVTPPPTDLTDLAEIRTALRALNDGVNAIGAEKFINRAGDFGVRIVSTTEL